MPAAILDLDLPPDHPIRQILDVIEAHPEVREPVLRVLLTEDFLALPGQVQGLSERVDGLTGQVTELREEFDEFREETREQFAAVNERIDETNRTMQGHFAVDAFDAVDARFDAVDARDAVDAPFRCGDAMTKAPPPVIRRVEGSIGTDAGLILRKHLCRILYRSTILLTAAVDGPVLADRETVINNQLRSKPVA